MIADLRAANRFLQILILPYPNSDGDHTCFITTRNEIQPSGPPTAKKGFDLFTFVCEQRPEALAAIVAGIIGGLAAAVALFLLIPFVGELLAAADIALITLLTPLLDPAITVGDYFAAAVNLITLGKFDWASSIVNAILSSFQSPSSRQNLSYKIMDTYDYNADCYKALSLEVAFNADDMAYQDYIQAVFNLISGFASQDVLVGAYISLRYCAGSGALLAIEQWPHTVCIEISSLGGLAGGQAVLNAFEQEAANRGATIHWGQSNSRSRADIEMVFPQMGRWRATLARVNRHGQLSTFDNDFCVSHGLEVFGVQKTAQDLSYLTPLLLTDDGSRDLSYLAPLLLSNGAV